MFIGISGPLEQDQHLLRDYLLSHGFKQVTLANEANALHFDSFDSLFKYTTDTWRENYVLCGINNSTDVDLLHKRPYFLHVNVDSNLQRKLSLLDPSSSSPEKLLQLLQLTEPDDALLHINHRAHVQVFLKHHSLEQIHDNLDKLKLWDPTRLRPSWDAYFMSLANLAALRSNCMKRRVGCVIVKESRVVATGYNGTPRHLTNCNEGGCTRCNGGGGSGAALSTCLCLHAEENALLEAGRDRIGDNLVLYCNTCPCLTCSVKIVQLGLKEVVYDQEYFMDDAARRVMNEAGVILRQFKSPVDAIIA